MSERFSPRTGVQEVHERAECVLDTFYEVGIPRGIQFFVSGEPKETGEEKFVIQHADQVIAIRKTSVHRSSQIEVGSDPEGGYTAPLVREFASDGVESAYSIIDPERAAALTAEITQAAAAALALEVLVLASKRG